MDNTKLPENKSKRNTHSSSSSSKKKKNVTQTKKESLSKNTAASKKNNKSQIPIDKNFFEVININIAVEDKKKNLK
jgi:hypothetical protein